MTCPNLPSHRVRATTSVVLRSGGIAAMLLALGSVPSVCAQDAGAVAASAPSGDASLRAVFIDVSGKVQWRAGEKDQWRDAKVDDVVDAGVEVRTGTRSHAALRLKNATVLVDAGTRFQIPTMVKDGETLRTTAAVTHGRADFKVDKVGLSNDFKVVTPSTTLAVRGTEFAISTGPLKQVEVVGARRNAINAIELKYALTNTTVQLSGSASSSSSVSHPAHAAVVAAAPPTPAAAGVPATTQGETVQNAAAGESPAASGSAAQAVTGNRATARAEKASGNAGGTASIVRRVQEQVSDAREKADQAVQYLVQAEGQLDTVLARRDALRALQTLAVARRDEARAALQSHEALLPGALALGSSADAAIGAFDAGRDAIGADFEEFDSQLANANDALDAIRIILDAGNGNGNGNGGSGGGPIDTGGVVSIVSGAERGGGQVPDDELSVLVEALRTALGAMDDAHASAEGTRDSIAEHREELLQLVSTLESGARAQALTAVLAYDAAVAQLNSALQSGEGAAAVADAAKRAVANLQSLIATLAVQSPTAQTVATARTALARLDAAATGLGRAVASLEAIRAARSSVTGDERAAALGQVEALYQRLVAARVRVLAEWADINAGIDGRGDQLDSAVADAEEVLGGVGDAFVVRALDADLAAGAFADGAELALEDAQLAAADRTGAMDDAGLLEDLALGVADVEDLAAESGERLAELAAASLADRLQLVDGAIDSLNAMNAALDGAFATAALIDEDLGDRLGGMDVASLAARASEALDAILAAHADASELASLGSSAHAAALAAGAGADHLAQVAAELRERFGISDSFAADAAAAIAALAGSAGSSAERAASARNVIAGLVAVARSEEIGSRLARIQELADARGWASTGGLALLERADAAYVATNELGSGTFRLMAQDSADAMSPFAASASSQLESLTQMATVSTQMVTALDGAEGAANAAERALTDATAMRVDAEANEVGAAGGLLRTQLFVDAGDLAGAGTQSALTGTFAAAARASATSAAGHADVAKDQVVIAQGFQADVNRLSPDVLAFGNNRNAFESSAAARRDAVDASRVAGDALAADAKFYDDVAQALAERAGTGTAAANARGSAAARAQAIAIAAELASSASQAAAMEQTASTNAGRLFGRSVSQYVGRAQSAANAAEAQAILANGAANRAEASASTAASLVNAGRGGSAAN
jgi:hypothetical protein